MFTNGSTAIERSGATATVVVAAVLAGRDAGVCPTYQPIASTSKDAATAYTRLLPTGAASRRMPSGVTSKAQAITSATGKPIIRIRVTNRGAHSGNCNCGARVAATWISNHATTR